MKLAAVLLVLAFGAHANEPDFGIGGHASPEAYPGMELVWREEFNGSELDARAWSHEIGTGQIGWGNEELQHYREENTRVHDGFLVITAREEAYEGSRYTSSRIITRDKRTFRFGRVDIRALLPEGQGIWPALWMLGSSTNRGRWPGAGEIDIMEMIGGQGRENTIHGSLHWAQDGRHVYEGGSLSLPAGTFNDQFHVFSLVWKETSIQWLVDGLPFLELDTVGKEFDAFREDFYLLINLAVGGRWPGAPDESTRFPQRLAVDYIRVFRQE